MRAAIVMLLIPVVAMAQVGKDHPASKELQCKTCHACEYPTTKNPCLIDCPRADLITVRHDAAVGPDVLVIDRFMDRYGPVIFSHRLHAEMADMGGGCESCHHYNTTGPILSCGSCHEPGSKSKEVGVPGLVAAYHRQCMACHREWEGTVNCQSCHTAANRKQPGKLQRLRKKGHQRTKAPSKIIFETKTDKGSKATFFHDQHTRLFGLSCVACHEGQGCTSCHDAGRAPSPTIRISDKRTEAEKHASCFKCHAHDRCSVCHAEVELKPFDHGARTGWKIKNYHLHVACQGCHKPGQRFTRVNRGCGSCHALQKSGSFRHEVVGLRLDGNHLGFACNDCHTGNRFDRSPDCSTCHDDKKWPKDRPGVRWP